MSPLCVCDLSLTTSSAAPIIFLKTEAPAIIVEETVPEPLASLAPRVQCAGCHPQSHLPDRHGCGVNRHSSHQPPPRPPLSLGPDSCSHIGRPASTQCNPPARAYPEIARRPHMFARLPDSKHLVVESKALGALARLSGSLLNTQHKAAPARRRDAAHYSATPGTPALIHTLIHTHRTLPSRSHSYARPISAVMVLMVSTAAASQRALSESGLIDDSLLTGCRAGCVAHSQPACWLIDDWLLTGLSGRLRRPFRSPHACWRLCGALAPVRSCNHVKERVHFCCGSCCGGIGRGVRLSSSVHRRGGSAS